MAGELRSPDRQECRSSRHECLRHEVSEVSDWGPVGLVLFSFQRSRRQRVSIR